MEKVCVVGVGSWGSALALALYKNGYKVDMWTRDESQANEINTTRVNSRFLPGVIFPKEMRISTDLESVIKDNGEGIDKEDIPNIFKRFYKGKNSKSDSVGIGLAMAKSIIESQNGDIYVKSEKNMGTEFHITFHKRYN